MVAVVVAVGAVKLLEAGEGLVLGTSLEDAMLEDPVLEDSGLEDPGPEDTELGVATVLEVATVFVVLVFVVLPEPQAAALKSTASKIPAKAVLLIKQLCAQQEW